MKLQTTRTQKNTVSALFNSAYVEVSSQTDLEQAHFDFYQDLYSQSEIDFHAQASLLDKLQVVLDDSQRLSCEGKISLDEISAALCAMSTQKTPGADGLAQEFYAKFWDLLGPILVEVYNFSFDCGTFSPSMRSSITCLLYKKDDKRNLKNWRPISLLNIDYKICSKALSYRLSKVLPVLIHEDQTCSVPGQSIFDNLKLLLDTLDYVNLTNEQGILLSLDQKEAFDRVDRSFLMQCLRRFGFGPDFQTWISSLYCNASMQVIVNGFLTDSVPLKRGVRQGDPLSPLLYI